MSAWKRVTDSTTPVDGRQVLAAFKSPNGGWVQFFAYAHNAPYGVFAPGYATPTHWQPIPEPPEDE